MKLGLASCYVIALALASTAAFSCGKSGNDPGGSSLAGSAELPNAESGEGGDSGAASSGGSESDGGSAPSGRSGAANDDAGSSGAADLAGGAGGAPPDSGPTLCAPGDTTTITGVVYDPAGQNPVYAATVYVPDPSVSLPDLDGVAMGLGCSQLMPAEVLARSAPTDESGHFEIPCSPSGTLSIVVQLGKWRRRYDNVKVARGRQNVIPNLRLPANSSEGSLPNIAISTGGSDSMECLPLRMGISDSEYVAGSTLGGHIHIYTGTRGAALAAGAVPSYQALWDSPAHLNAHDVVVLSCEGEETRNGTSGNRVSATEQQYLMDYANAGGRVLADHYHYAWFNTGPFAIGDNALAEWYPGIGNVDESQLVPAEVNTTLSSGGAFPEGAALAKWLSSSGALTSNQLTIFAPHANVKALRPRATEWLHLSPSDVHAPSATQLFSVEMPMAVGTAVRGRIVYSTMHMSPVGADPIVMGIPSDYVPDAAGTAGGAGFPGFPNLMEPGVVPSGCARHPLTPQESALEFMLLALSSCLTPIGEDPLQP